MVIDKGQEPGKSYDQLKKKFIDGEISRKQFLDENHNPANYHQEVRSENRSNRHTERTAMVKRHTIHRFARMNDSKKLSRALDSGADIDERDEFTTTALHYSISENNPDITFLLLERGADVLIQDGDGSTALHYAAEYDAIDMADAIIKQNGQVVRVADIHGNEPLWTACFRAHSRGDLDLVRLLLDAGGRPRHRNAVGKTPLTLAQAIGMEALAELLSRKTTSRTIRKRK